MLFLSAVTIGFTLCLVIILSVAFRRSKAAGGTRAGSVRLPIKQILQSPEKIKYNKIDVPLPPPDVGRKVRLLAWLQHTVLGKNVLSPMAKAKTGLDMLSGEYIPEKPTYTVSMPVPIRTSPITNEDAIQQAIEAHNGKPYPRVSCVDLNKAFRDSKCDPIVVTETVLNCIDTSNTLSPPLRAIVEIDREEVRRMARESAARWQEGKPLSLLDGVPISIKGQYNVLPYQCTAGCSFQPTCAQHLPESVVVERLKKAGAVIIGIANMQEAAAGTYGSNPNRSYKIARNPYDTDYFCGGSSSGSGCSVSAGLCPISLGSDDGGSIRIPAAFCGVYGLKPTFGLLDTTGFAPISHSVGVIGPLATSAIDIAVAMDTMCPDNIKLDLSDIANGDVDGIKIGVYWEYFEHADKEIVVICKSAIKKLINNGAACHSIKIAELAETRIAHAITTDVEFGSSLAIDVDQNFSNLGVELLVKLASGYTYSAADYINCQKQRTRAIETLEEIFNEVHVIATPLVPCLAPKVPPGANDHGLLSKPFWNLSKRFTFLPNFTGIPSIVVPVGLSGRGLPVSLQIMAPWYCEGRLLQIANVLEKEMVDDFKPPNICYDLLENFN